MNRTSTSKTKKYVLLALMCAIGYILTFVGRLPISTVGFLKYDPKDVIIVIGGFIYGPLSAILMSVIVSFIEMITISDTNIIGCIMNIVSTVSFAAVAATIYQKRRTMSGAVIALVTGMFAMTASMIVWNYFLTPIFYGMPRSEVVKMLVPIFLPFNIIKSGLNTAFTLIVYKPFVNAIRRSGLLEHGDEQKSKANAYVIIAALFLTAMCIGAIFILNHK